jgi:hypothetical protein
VANFVCLTTDVWTDRRQHAYLGVTVHMFLSGKSVSHLLAFQHFDGSHTGQRIADALDEIVTENNLQGKIRYIVTDNASNMKKAMSILFEEISDANVNSIESYLDDPTLYEDVDIPDSSLFEPWKRIPCFSHSLQLVIRDGLQTTAGARSALAKVSKLANILHQSALFRNAFETTCGKECIVPESNATRWNSTFRQLKAVTGLDQQKLTEVLKSTSHENLIFSTKEVQQINELVTILAPFAEATDLSQSERTVSISCVIPVLLSLNHILMNPAEPIRHFPALVSSLQKGIY